MMFSLLNPWVILSLVLALTGTFFAGHHEGYKQKETEDAVLIAQKNQEMNDSKEKADADLDKAKKTLAAKNSQLVDAIRTGQQRLFIPIAAQAGCAATATGDGQARAELDSKVSESLVSITNEGDQAILDLNSCIDRYNQIRSIASGHK